MIKPVEYIYNIDMNILETGYQNKVGVFLFMFANRQGSITNSFVFIRYAIMYRALPGQYPTPSSGSIEHCKTQVTLFYAAFIFCTHFDEFFMWN
jgi:hypothetical protein